MGGWIDGMVLGFFTAMVKSLSIGVGRASACGGLPLGSSVDEGVLFLRIPFVVNRRV